jgi:hypothetical protein
LDIFNLKSPEEEQPEESPQDLGSESHKDLDSEADGEVHVEELIDLNIFNLKSPEEIPEESLVPPTNPYLNLTNKEFYEMNIDFKNEYKSTLRNFRASKGNPEVHKQFEEKMLFLENQNQQINFAIN